MFPAELARIIIEERERELRGWLRLRQLLRERPTDDSPARVAPGLGRRVAAFLLARQA